MDHAAKLCSGSMRVAEFDRLGLFQHQRHEGVGDAFLHQDAFDRRAALPRIAGGPGHGDGGGLFQIGRIKVIQNDQRVVAAKLERVRLYPPFGDHLADRHAAGEGDDVDVRVGDHFVADVLGPAGDDLEHLGRQAGLVQNVGQRDRGQRRQFGRLADHAVVGGDGRGDLVRHHVQRMVERGDRADRPHRFALGENLPRLALGCQVAREDLPVIENGKLPGQREHVIGPPGFVQRMLLADAKLQRQPVGDFLAPLADQFGGLEQDLLAFVAGQRRLDSSPRSRRRGRMFGSAAGTVPITSLV